MAELITEGHSEAAIRQEFFDRWVSPRRAASIAGLRRDKDDSLHRSDFAGTIRADLQFVQLFAAVVVKGAKNPEASKRLIEFLALSEKGATPTVEK